MDPSEVRRAVLDQHEGLRRQLADLEAVAMRLLLGEGRDAEIKERFARFDDVLARHMRFEDTFLRPALLEVDPWGPERVQALFTDHVRQRFILGHVRQRFRSSDAGGVELALIALGLEQLLLHDMQEEEGSVLKEDLLCDDPMVIEQEPE